MSRDTTVPRERGQFWQVQMGLTQPLLSPRWAYTRPGAIRAFRSKEQRLGWDIHGTVHILRSGFEPGVGGS